MDRRIALKNMGLALGYTIATPTLLSIVQSCNDVKADDWTPLFMSKEEGSVLIKLVDIILPKTDTPSASEVNVHVFIDKFAHEVMEAEEQAMTKTAMGKFIEKALADSKKEKMEDLEAEDLEPVLASALQVTKEDEVANMEALMQYGEAIKNGEPAQLDDTVFRYSFANNLRGMTIWGYKTSEYVGENVLAYLPVPGEYIGCGDLNELTGGKAWSI